ncbi:colipase isoform X2 [Tachyglossus aculeatus]|uniref:colipase isoform X2 n=1 Tax=Tachyglossus aculeatus TaxID=9261 RepID=UPI0018F54FFA|nr:colipase isoform X2 [Tachyglossus aculeatus]
MKAFLLLLLLCLALGLATAAPQTRGLITNLTIYDVYHKCPCEQGLTCETDWTIIGAITNTNYGICLDDSRSKQ